MERMTRLLLVSLAFAVWSPAATRAETLVLTDCPCVYTYYPHKDYTGASGKTEQEAKDNAWASWSADTNNGFKKWLDGLEGAAPKCPEGCEPPRKVSPHGPLTYKYDIKNTGTKEAPVYVATLIWQTKMTVTCGTPPDTP
jgi:hypothetical protein